MHVGSVREPPGFPLTVAATQNAQLWGEERREENTSIRGSGGGGGGGGVGRREKVCVVCVPSPAWGVSNVVPGRGRR